MEFNVQEVLFFLLKFVYVCVFFFLGGGRMGDTHIIRFGTRERESSPEEADHTQQHTPRTGNMPVGQYYPQ